MRNYLMGLVLFGLLAPAAARAELGTIDNMPAAALLPPYFEVDLGNPNGITTLFTFTNTGSINRRQPAADGPGDRRAA